MLRGVCKVLIFVAFFHYNSTVEVTIKSGTLVGATYSSRNGRQFYGFTGVPFAKPPVGDLRFEPPQPEEPWKGMKNATQPAPLCIQGMTTPDEFLDFLGQEDCLYLNVFTPIKIPKDHSWPVMVWIHGGAYFFGGASLFDPKYFMDYDIIVVTIQYRLSILGFLSTGDHLISANNGMKDQSMALHWVKENIAAFGGNPNSVTIFGESAGGSSVGFHVKSPLSKGLFHRAILESGSALSPWALVPPKIARERAFTLGTVTFCSTKNSLELVNCLKNIPAEELVLAHRKFFAWDEEPFVTFGVVPEPGTVKKAFITEKSLYGNDVTSVPWIIGTVSGEGIIKIARYLYGDGKRMEYIAKNYKRILPISLMYGYFISKERNEQIIESIKNFYFGEKNISYETRKEIIDLYSDTWFTFSSIESAKRHTNTTYFYYYDHRNMDSFAKIFGNNEENLGVAHGDELLSLFPIEGFFPEIVSGDDLNVSERLVKYWVNFATTGNPSSNGLWTPTKSGPVEYLHITTHKDEMKSGLLEERYQFWKKLNIYPS